MSKEKDEADKLSDKLFLIILVATVIYAAAVAIFVL